ncbi:hypothetical protein CLV63_11053 [Murinocardiopsis flavida]|uniref:SWIM-type domain-containing protein n=1 Tax=Murinocardiopsis flavida TaxID=645275 RepID=A0A2P8DHS0_9ACTN|nr:hypothetical protein [Murinocardiopsis flavida]PSK96756.1 hypothetical protein CLV63_11053 [Murinocardiopsis flavida]
MTAQGQAEGQAEGQSQEQAEGREPAAGPERPVIEAGLAARLLEAAPARVRRKLDADPRAAREWQWTREDGGWRVAAGAETVRLDAAVLTDASEVGCSCLLGPRCLHLLAVIGVLDVATDDPEEPAGGSPAADGAPGPGPEVAGPQDSAGLQDPAGRSVPAGRRAPDGSQAPAGVQPSAGLRTPVALGADAAESARLAWAAGADLLATGVRAAGVPHRTGLLRAASAARAARLPRLAAACTTAAAGIRDAETPDFALSGYAAALSDLLELAWRLGGGPEGPRPAAVLADAGVARRAYTEIGGLRLYGLACERVVTGSGYAGVVSHVVAAGSYGPPTLWRIGGVVPGGPGQVTAAYRGPVEFGGLTMSHRDLTRSGALAQAASGSADGRLSGGTAATAAAVGGATWWEEPLSSLWEEPAGRQVERALAALAAPSHRTGEDFVFADVTDIGPGPDGTVTAAVVGLDGRVSLAPAAPDDRMTARNLARVAARPGTAARIVARPVPGRPRTLVPIALAPAQGPASGPVFGASFGPASRSATGQGYPLPERYAGRVNLGLDELDAPPPSPPPSSREGPPGAAAAGESEATVDAPAVASGRGSATAAKPAPGPRPPTGALRRALHRIAEGGRGAAPAIAALVPTLKRSGMGGAAELLGELDTAARERVRVFTGESTLPAPDRLALVWTTAMAYTRAAEGSLDLDAWTLPRTPH